MQDGNNTRETEVRGCYDITKLKPGSSASMGMTMSWYGCELVVSTVDFWSQNAQIFGGKVLELTVLHTDYYSHKIVP